MTNPNPTDALEELRGIVEAQEYSVTAEYELDRAGRYITRFTVSPEAVEELARIIDPWAFSGKGTKGWDETYGEARREVARAKARACLTLLAQRALNRGGE